MHDDFTRGGRGTGTTLSSRHPPGALLLLPLVLASSARAEPPSPELATAFLRVSGKLRAEVTRAWKETVERPAVAIGTGSGFLISPLGHLVTSHHVVEGRAFSVEQLDSRVDVAIDVERIEVFLPALDQRFDASLVASDPDLDLALLALSVSDLPYLRIGDSDALQPGDGLRVLGFPFGSAVEVGRERPAGAVPRASDSRGRVSALRRDAQGRARYVQTDATVNPGNSGGPVLDEDGYVIGVVRMRIPDADGVGFAVSSGALLDFLAATGYDQFLPARRLRLGPHESLSGKGLALRLPEGLADQSPSRLRARAPAPEGALELEIDRIASPWPAAEVAERLLAAEGFDVSLAQAAQDGSAQQRIGPASARATPSGDSGAWGLAYTVLALEGEVVVARYRAPVDEIALNRGVLLGSLASLAAEPLLQAEGDALDADPGLEPARGGPDDGPRLRLPRGWLREPPASVPEDPLPAPDVAFQASPEADYRIRFRASWWRDAPLGAGPAARTRSLQPSGLGAGSYALTRDRFGLRYAVEGLFLTSHGSLLALEVEVPTDRVAEVRPIAAAWIQSHLAPTLPDRAGGYDDVPGAGSR